MGRSLPQGEAMSREAFEASYASSHDLPLETFSQYRMGDTYRLPGIASHWRTWCAALDSVVVELPTPETPESYGVCEADDPEQYEQLEARSGAQYSAIFKCQKAIEAAGIKHN
jgi:hypothetical protein